MPNADKLVRNTRRRKYVSDPNGWRSRFDAYSGAFEPALGDQEGPPEGYTGDV